MDRTGRSFSDSGWSDMREHAKKAEAVIEGQGTPGASLDKIAAIRDEGMSLSKQGRFEEARKQLEQALALMEEANAPANDRAMVLAYLATSYRILGIVDKAEAVAGKALELIKEPNVETGVKAEVFFALGSNYLRKGDRAVGMRHLERALSLYEMLKDKDGQGRTCRNIGMGYIFNTNFPKAVVYFRKAHGLFKDLGNVKDTAQCLGNLAVAKAEEGMFKDAVEDMKGVLVLARASKAEALQAGTLLNISMTYVLMGRPDEAVSYSDEGLSIANSMNDKRMTASIIVTKAEALLIRGQVDEAKSLVDENFKMAIGIKAHDLQGTAFKVRGTIFREKGDLKKAQDDYSSAEKFYKASEQQSPLAELYMEWAIAAHMAGEGAKAKEMADRARTIFKKSNVPHRLKRLDEVLKKHGI